MREADERHDQDIARRHRAELFQSATCGRGQEHERCLMPGCECRCHPIDTPSIERDPYRYLSTGELHEAFREEDPR